MIATLTTQILKDSRIPRKFWKLGSKTYGGDTRALKQAAHYVSNFELALDSDSGVGIYFYGPPCSYKTFLATYIVKCLLVRGFNGTYWTLDSLLNEVKGHATNIESLVGEDDCIIIDNVTRPVGQDNWQFFFLRKIIRVRSDNSMPYIICSSLDPKDMEQAYGPDVYARLRNDLIAVACSNNQSESDFEKLNAERKRELILTEEEDAE